MVQVLTKFLYITLISLLSIFFNLTSKGTSKQIQQLHTKISNDLLGIRKAYPKSQLVVYSVLDQVCKMYTLSKKVLIKKKKLKKQLAIKEQEKNGFRVKLLTVKNKMLKIENEFNKSKDSFELTNKNLEQKNSLLTQLNKEKIDLLNNKKNLQEKNRALTLKIRDLQNQNGNKEQSAQSEIPDKEPEYLNKIYNPNMKQRKNRLKDTTQSLNLTSTSDPISPL